MHLLSQNQLILSRVLSKIMLPTVFLNTILLYYAQVGEYFEAFRIVISLLLLQTVLSTRALHVTAHLLWGLVGFRNPWFTLESESLWPGFVSNHVFKTRPLERIMRVEVIRDCCRCCPSIVFSTYRSNPGHTQSLAIYLNELRCSLCLILAF